MTIASKKPWGQNLQKIIAKAQMVSVTGWLGNDTRTDDIQGPQQTLQSLSSILPSQLPRVGYFQAYSKDRMKTGTTTTIPRSMELT
jgi:hypothetical protein